MITNEGKFRIQDEQYDFPYHYIPQLYEGYFKKERTLRHGGEYLSYIKYVAEAIVKDGFDNVLDVGCGDGRLCQFLSGNKGMKRIKGIDLSEKAIAWARTFNPDIEFAVQDVSAENDKWEAITAVEVFEHIPDSEMNAFVKGIEGCMAEKGCLYITVPSVNVPLSKKHFRHYTPELLSKQVEAANCNLKVVEAHYIVPNRTIFDLFFIRLTNNRLWTTPIFDKIVWNRLWRDGLRASDKSGAHIFAKVERF